MDDLLIKYILEEATPEERGQVQQWLAANADNRAHFEKLQAVWQLAASPNRQPATDTPQALQRLKQTLQARETAPIKRLWPHKWIAAAAVMGIAGMAFGTYVLLKPRVPVKKQPPVVLPDTAHQKPVRVDTTPTALPTPAVQPVPALPADTIPVVKPRKKKKPEQVKPVQPVHRKKKVPEPAKPVNATPVKKKVPEQAQTVKPAPVRKKKPPVSPQPVPRPVKKHKVAPAPKTPPEPAKEPPIT